MIRKLSRYRELSKQDQRLAWTYAITVPCVELSLRLFGFKRVVGVLSCFFNSVLPVTGDAPSIIDRHHRMLKQVCANLPFSGKCLAQSLTLGVLLKRQGIDTELRFGQRNVDGRLDAHAWIEYSSHPINASAKVCGRFTAFETPIQFS